MNTSMTTSDHIVLRRHWMGHDPGWVGAVETIGRGACRELVRRNVADWYDDVAGKAVLEPPADKMIHSGTKQTKARKRTA